MRLLKAFARLAVFFITFGLATFLTGLLPAPVAPDAPPATPVETQLTYKPVLVTIDRAVGLAYTQLVVEHAAGTPAPERLWVWTYFFTPDGGLIWGTMPVEVRAPFARGDRAPLTVSAPCGRCAATMDNFYARVQVATSPPPAGFQGASLSTDIETATPVVFAH